MMRASSTPMHAGSRATSSSATCLWIGRYVPYPINEGMKLYSAKLVESVARSGIFVRALGFGDLAHAPAIKGVQWIAISGERGRDLSGIVNRLPLAAAVDATPEYKDLLDRQLREHWDVIVFDSYASGWALDRCRRYRTAQNTQALLVHVSHNHETAVWRSMAQHSNASPVHRWLMRRNAIKVAQLERDLATNVDLVTTITDEDANALSTTSNAAPTLTLMPGYDGPIAAPRMITHRTPRRVVIVGSFNWVVKRENLTRFVQHADPIFARHDIELLVAGEMPEELRTALEAKCRASTFRGFVSDLAPLLAESRIAIVPELIGGGFKLKFLDYFFGRVPVATVSAAAAGIPAALREQLLMGEDIAALTQTIVDHIDDLDELNRRQATVFEQATTLFRWEDRGAQLDSELDALRAKRWDTEDHRLLGS